MRIESALCVRRVKVRINHYFLLIFDSNGLSRPRASLVVTFGLVSSV